MHVSSTPSTNLPFRCTGIMRASGASARILCARGPRFGRRGDAITPAVGAQFDAWGGIRGLPPLAVGGCDPEPRQRLWLLELRPGSDAQPRRPGHRAVASAPCSWRRGGDAAYYSTSAHAERHAWGKKMMGWQVISRTTMLTGAAAAVLGACGAESPEPSPVPVCGIPECLRAVECVTECGGPVVSSGCCPCAEGTFDSITCPTSSASQ
jgi:hypothetical protein